MIAQTQETKAITTENDYIVYTDTQIVWYCRGEVLDFFNGYFGLNCLNLEDLKELVTLTNKHNIALLESETDFKEIRGESTLVSVSLKSDFGKTGNWKWQRKTVTFSDGMRGRCQLNEGAFTIGHHHYKMAEGEKYAYSATYQYIRDFTISGMASPKRYYDISILSKLSDKQSKKTLTTPKPCFKKSFATYKELA